MQELKLFVPTYNARYFRGETDSERIGEFGVPMLPVVIREADGVRIVLGTHEYWQSDAPDIQIERQPNGWVIFLHPLGGGDPWGYFYFRDDGRSFLQTERAFGPTEAIEILEPDDEVPGFDPPTQSKK